MISPATRTARGLGFALAISLFVGCNGPYSDARRPDDGHVDDLVDDLVDAPRSAIGDFAPQPSPPVVEFPRAPRLDNSIVIGLDADMSSAAAQSGESIRRGVALAIEEVNEGGGVLGRPLELVVRDHRGNPDRGVDNIKAFAEMDNLVAVVGGIHTPVAIKELPEIHRRQVIYLGPWAAGTPIVSNGYVPNYVFRVSVRDEYAGEFLVAESFHRGSRRLGLLLERTAWGRSNEKAIKQALENRASRLAATVWFNWGETNFDTLTDHLLDAGVDTILLVANPLEGSRAIKAMLAQPADRRVRIISHWGISGGHLPGLGEQQLADADLMFLQTYSFLSPKQPERMAPVLERYLKMFPDCKSAGDIIAPTGTAHAYDLIQLLITAIEHAGTTNRAAVRNALESLTFHRGLIKDYAPPFRPDHHDALDSSDFCLARFGRGGTIVPVE